MYEKIQSGNLPNKYTTKSKFKYGKKSNSLTFTREEIRSLQIPYIDTAFNNLQEITVKDTGEKIHYATKIVNEGFETFATEMFSTLGKLAFKHKLYFGIYQPSQTPSTARYFMATEISQRLDEENHFLLDFRSGKGINDPLNRLNMHKMYLALLTGRYIRLSHTESTKISQNTDFITEFSIFEESYHSRQNKANILLHKSFSNFLSKYQIPIFLDTADYGLVIRAQFCEGRFLFDLLTSDIPTDIPTPTRPQVSKKQIIKSYINFRKLNDIAPEILNDKKDITIGGVKYSEIEIWRLLYDEYINQGELSREDHIKQFITVFAKIYKKDVNGNRVGEPITWDNFDLGYLYSQNDYIIEVNERFTEALRLNYL